MELAELSMRRLSTIDPKQYAHLEVGDECVNYGEHISHGGHAAGETNQQIKNLKWEPSSPSNRLYWKERAIGYWAGILMEALNFDVCRTQVTFVPVPCSITKGEPDYDDRLIRILKLVSERCGPLDIRELVVQTQTRLSQHKAGKRFTPDELLASMAIDPTQLKTPMRPNIVVFDDVLTMGASFRAMKRLIMQQPGVNKCYGLFLAKTVWPNPFAAVPLTYIPPK